MDSSFWDFDTFDDGSFLAARSLQLLPKRESIQRFQPAAAERDDCAGPRARQPGFALRYFLRERAAQHKEWRHGSTHVFDGEGQSGNRGSDFHSLDDRCERRSMLL